MHPQNVGFSLHCYNNFTNLTKIMNALKFYLPIWHVGFTDMDLTTQRQTNCYVASQPKV